MEKESKYLQYQHHGVNVFVRKDLKGRHRDHCLCFSCEKLGSGGGKSGCEIANHVYANCVKFNLVTPVFECPRFKGSK